MSETDELIDRNKKLLKLHAEKQREKEGQALLEKLPQGEGSGLNADMVDGKHASEMARFTSYGETGGGGVTDHGALTGLADDDHTQYALADKSRPTDWPPSAHDLGGAKHNADTLADLNNKISDGTLLDTGDIQFKTGALHAAGDHESGGSLAVKLDDLAAPDDNTDLDVSTTKHGLTPKAPDEGLEALDGRGNYSQPWAHQCHHRTFYLPFTYTNDWTKLGTVLSNGAAGKFDDTLTMHPSVVKVGDYYYVFYAGNDATGGGGIGVARFTDPEGAYTRLNSGDPIIGPTANTRYHCPSVIYDDYETDSNKKWKMWFLKINYPTPVTRQIMYSYSANPDSGWSAPAEVFADADDPWFGECTIRMGRLWLHFLPKETDRQLYLYCSSAPDNKGVDQGLCLALGAGGTWDDVQVRYIGVVYISGILYVLYSGYDGSKLQIGMAACTGDITDETLYAKYALNPIIPIGSGGDPDDVHAFAPCLLQIDEKFYVWYTGDAGGTRTICLARIP